MVINGEFSRTEFSSAFNIGTETHEVVAVPSAAPVTSITCKYRNTKIRVHWQKYRSAYIPAITMCHFYDKKSLWS